MKYDQIVAGLIRKSLDATSVRSHDRVLLRGYDDEKARPIVERLLDGPGTTHVGLPEDDGSISQIELPAVQWGSGSRTVEVLPFVVTETPRSDDPPWLGTQGFASRLRTSFHLMSEPGVVRVLVLFDTRPVETEQSTASEQLAFAMDSLNSLVTWFDSPDWKAGFAPNVFNTTMDVIRWWRARISDEPGWNSAPHYSQFEQAASFMEACRPSSAPSDIGLHLPILGLLFRDPDLMTDRQLSRRLQRNADLAQKLESIRRQRVLDPIIEADRILDLGPPGEPFYDELVGSLRSTNAPVTQVSIAYSEINDRLRTRDRHPAWLDVFNLDVVALGPDGVAQGESLPWRLLSEAEAPRDNDRPVEIVVPCPTKAVRIHIPVQGDLRAFLYRDETFLSQTGDEEGAMVPGNVLPLQLDRPDTFSVTELLVREKRPGRGRPPRPTQVVHLGVIAGERIAVPEDSFLDVEQGAFVVDGALDSIKVQIGGTEVRVADMLPPQDGSVTEVDVDGVAFKWVGDDRSPTPEHDPAPRKDIRLLELVGVRQSGNPKDSLPYYLEGGGLAATCRTSALLDVEPSWMEEECKLLLQPDLFVGIKSDNAAAVELLVRTAPEAFQAWLDARISFFNGVRESCERALPGEGGRRPSMYLADLRQTELGNLAHEYVTTYSTLLDTVSNTATATANRAIIEPVLLCDRASSAADAIRLAPTHPTAVAFLSSVQRGLLSNPWNDENDRESLEQLLAKPLLSGLLPWLPWRGHMLVALQNSPLLWRCYGQDGGSLDTSDELGPVVVQKAKRLLNLAPHLNVPGQRVYINVEIGRGTGGYLVDALRELERDKGTNCAFDVGVVCADDAVTPDLVRLFTTSPAPSEGDPVRDRLHGFVRVCRLRQVTDRAAHIVFRMEAAESDKQPFASMSESHPLVRETGFAGGLSYEPMRFATTTLNEVVYTRYVATAIDDVSSDNSDEGSWNGKWRMQYHKLCRLSQHAAVGLQSEIRPDSIPCQTLRQIADGDSTENYNQSFITVHCDPAQGPEFFVGARTTRSGVFLVECSDRGSPELPGRDIVSVTSRIGPFRAALATAVGTLPSPLNELVDDDVARGLLRDINILRGTEVFDFLREISRETSHIYFMDGLDNVLALRFLMSSRGRLPGYLPVVVALRDFTARCSQLEGLRSGTKCDDIIVFYLPKFNKGTPTLLYRLVEVKFGPRGQQWGKAQQQLSETSQKLSLKLPPGRWMDERSPTALLLEHDLAWTLYEALERYRAFGLLLDDEEMEHRWGFQGLFRCLHRGDFELTPYDTGDSGSTFCLNGTAMMLDTSIPGASLDVTEEKATEYLTVPRDIIADLLVKSVAGLGAGSKEDSPPSSSSVPSVQPDTSETPTDQENPEIRGRIYAVDPAASGNELPTGHSQGCAVESLDSPNEQEQEVSSAGTGSADAVGNTEETRPDKAVREQAQLQVDEVFDGFVGNTGPVTRLKRSLTIARLEGKSWIEPVGLFGPKSTGKTELARRIARALDLPRVELSETLLRSADDLATKIQETAEESGRPMRMVVDPHGATIVRAPAMVVFIDEVHLLRARVQESLLKALEPDDRTLLSTIGTIDTMQVTFIIATTDPGDLGDAFKSRVARFELREYTLDEVVQILDAHRQGRADFPPEACQFDQECLRIFARVGRQVPRQALRLIRDAAREVGVGFLLPQTEALRLHYWENYRADDKGLTDRDRAYLRILFPDQVVGLDALAAQLGEGRSTISADLEPYLLRLGLIERGRGGRSLTRLGRELVPTLAE